MKEFIGPPDNSIVSDKSTIKPPNGESLCAKPFTGLPTVRGVKGITADPAQAYLNELLARTGSCKDQTFTIRDNLTNLSSTLGDPRLRDLDVARQSAIDEREALFADKFAKALVTYPIPPKERLVSAATFTRLKTGEALPTFTEFARMADHMSASDKTALGASDKTALGASDKTLPHELRRELEDGLRAAHKVPWSVKAQLAARAAAAAAAATQLATAAATVDQLQTEIIDLEAALVAVAAGSEEELRLRNELDAANTRLREALAQHHEDSKNLVTCAVELSGAVTAYLDCVNRSAIAHVRAPSNKLRRRPVTTPKVRRRTVAGRRKDRTSWRTP